MKDEDRKKQLELERSRKRKAQTVGDRMDAELKATKETKLNAR